jgi:hypothetical protein
MKCVINRQGNKELFDVGKISKSLSTLCVGLDGRVSTCDDLYSLISGRARDLLLILALTLLTLWDTIICLNSPPLF